MSVRRLVEQLVALARTRRLDRDLDGEIAAHLALAEQDAVARGLSREEARREARLQFGPVERTREEHREARTVRWAAAMLQDARHAARLLTRDWHLTGLAVGVLAVGIGASAAMFSTVDAVLLKPLPFLDPERIVRVWQAPRPGATNGTSPLDFRDWQRLATSFDALAAEEDRLVTLTGAGEPVRLTARAVTADYFDVFATPVQFGRVLLTSEDSRAASPVVVLSHRGWQTHFGGDRGILGRRILLDDVAHEVVGVLAPGAFDREQVDAWLPLVFTPAQEVRDVHWLTVSGRLRKGTTLAAARADMRAIDAAIDPLLAAGKREWTIEVESLDRLLVSDGVRRSVLVGFAAATMVMLIACANVANLLLARMASRRKELSMRAALGASRGRLAAQMLTESVVLAALGGAGGVLLAHALLRAGMPSLLTVLPSTTEVALDARVLGFVIAVVVGVAVMVGVLPALQVRQGHLWHPLAAAGRGAAGSHAPLRRAIVAAEVALSLVLLAGAGLMLRSLANLQRLDTGVRIDDVTSVSLDLPTSRYATADRAGAFFDALGDRVSSAPGVTEAGFTTALPLRWIMNGEGLIVPGLDELVRVRVKRVDAGYFRVFDIQPRSGRLIQDTDRAGTAPVIVVNEALARRLREATGRDPVGLGVLLTSPPYADGAGGTHAVEVIGVLHSERVAAPGRPDPPVVYASLRQLPSASAHLVMRGHGTSVATAPVVQGALGAVDPHLPIGPITTMAQVREDSLSGMARPAWTIGVLAVLASGLAAFGLYGVVAHSVSLQRREFGIRMAVGASPATVLWGTVWSMAPTVAAGLAVGLLGVLALTRWVRQMLYDVSPLDPATIGAGCLLLTLVAIAATVVPARRAARLSPATVLRDE